jgi:hypothetical protein
MSTLFEGSSILDSEGLELGEDEMELEQVELALGGGMRQMKAAVGVMDVTAYEELYKPQQKQSATNDIVLTSRVRRVRAYCGTMGGKPKKQRREGNSTTSDEESEYHGSGTE